MAKYVEIKGSDGQPAGHVMDYENGYQEVYDQNGQPTAYVYDQEAMNKSMTDSIDNDNNEYAGSRGEWPSIKKNGLFCCAIVYGARIARYLFPIIFLFSQASIIPAALCYGFLWALEYWWDYIAYNFYPCYWQISSLVSCAGITVQILAVLFANFF